MIGTVGTIASGAYVHAVDDAAAAAGVERRAGRRRPAPGFVEFVERGQTSGDEVTVLAERLLAPVRAADVDALLLGCTHYPFLARVIGDVMGHGVTLVSSADETAFAARRMLGELGLLRAADDRVGAHRFLSSGDIDDVPRARRPPARPRAQPHRALGPADRLTSRERTTDAPSRRPRPRRAPPVSFERDFTEMADGSCLVSFGRTRVLCTASIDEDVPRWMRGSGKGWVTAEYSMLPGSSPERVDREAAKGKQSGRTVEIQRLIGRSLRAACDMTALGERQVVVDCDVLQADGGTRTASICGGFLALHDALARLVAAGQAGGPPAALVLRGDQRRHRRRRRRCSTCPYVEDSTAEVDMNVVMLRPVAGGEPRFVEVQGTAEGMAFTRGELDQLLGARRARADRDRRPAGRDGVGPAGRPPMTPAALVCASANPDKVAEIAGDPRRRRRAAAAPGRGARRRRGRRHAGGQRPAQGGGDRRRDRRGRRSPTTPGSRSPPSAGAPGVRTGRYAGERRHVRRQPGQAARRARRRRRPARPGSAPWRWSSGPTGASSPPRACATGTIADGRAGRGGASATTPCSCPTTATGARSPR